MLLQSIQEETDSDHGVDENTPMRPGQPSRQDRDQLLSPDIGVSRFFNIDTRIELGEMATMFFSPLGRMLFYVTMIVYLFGDLSIYSVAISKSTMDVIW